MKSYLGIELGSTRIKAVLIDEKAQVIASGAYNWENSLVDGLWTYSLSEIWQGLQTAYSRLNQSYFQKFGAPIKSVTAIGVSGMMHGYLAFDKGDNLLFPFITWRNTNAAEAADVLSNLFNFNVPMRWSVSQFYGQISKGAEHVKNVAFLTTLSGYVHYKLTGKKVLGVGDACGMFPVENGDYNVEMINKFKNLTGVDIKELLPKVLLAGENAGELTKEGARLLDVSGNLPAGIPLCPPEGDMATGMICTNAVLPGSANVSSGTCANLTAVLGKPLKNYYREIDIIAAPNGFPAALVHTNNCTTEINQWINLFGEAAKLFGAEAEEQKLFNLLFNAALSAEGDGGDIVAYNFSAGEPLAGTKHGVPSVFRDPSKRLTLAGFMRAQLYSAIAAISLGTDILKEEGVKINSVTAHGGFYKTDFVGQNYTSALLQTPVTVYTTAGEGGAWGMALLAAYAFGGSGTLPEYLAGIFKNVPSKTVTASKEEVQKFKNFIKSYKSGLNAVRAASQDIF